MNKLSKKVVKLLVKKKLKISFAESCTGGLLSSSITSISGSSKVLILALTYSNSSKIKILKIPPQTIKKYGAVNHETCKSMVNNLCKISKTDISLSNTVLPNQIVATNQSLLVWFLSVLKNQIK